MLFRKESIEARSTKRQGEIRLFVPPAHKWLSLILLVVGVIGIVFASTAAYTKKERVPGKVVLPIGVTYLRAPAASYVEEVFVAPGQAVERGHVLLSLSAGSSTRGGSVAEQLVARLDERRELAESAVAERQKEHAQLRAKLEASLLTLSEESRQIDAQIGFQRRLLVVLEEDLSRVNSLLEERYVSKIQASQAEAAVLDARSQLTVLRRDKSRIDREIGSVTGELQEAESQWKLASSTLESDVLQIQAESIRDQATLSPYISAPVSGLVSEVHVRPGENVPEGGIVATLVPDGDKVRVELSVPSRAIGMTRLGQKVMISIDSFPHERFGLFTGTVAEIASTPTADFQASQSSDHDVSYRVYVDIDSSKTGRGSFPIKLLPGMQAQADLMLDTRTLGQWLLAPIMEARARYN